MRNGSPSPVNPPLLTLLGPTASGKTSLAVGLAQHLNAEIISCDSRQVYKYMDIGTGKDLDQYGATPYHLINIREPGTSYDVAEYCVDFLKVTEDIASRGKQAIICGGSGLYLQAVLQGFQQINIPQNPALRSRLEQYSDTHLRERFQQIQARYQYRHDIQTRKRLIRAIEIGHWLEQHPHAQYKNRPRPSCIFGLNPEPALRRAKISERLNARLESGLLSEVEQLLERGVSQTQLIRYGLEYKFACYYLAGTIPFPVFYQKLETAIHRYAKRQMTYFRKMEKDGLKIHWLEAPSKAEQIQEILNKQNEFL